MTNNKLRTKSGDRVFYLGAAVDQGSHDYPPTKEELEKPMTETFDIELIKALQTIRKFIEVGKAELEKIPNNTKEQNDILIREAVERNKLLEELESKNND